MKTLDMSGVQKSNWIGQNYTEPRVLAHRSTKIHAGDHLELQRTGYKHHAIAVSNEDRYGNVQTMEWNTSGKLGIENPIFVKMTRNARNEEIWIVKYDHSIEAANPLEKILARAKEFEGREGWSRKTGYDLFESNCEHATRYIKTGEWKSEQVDNLQEAASIFGYVAAGTALAVGVGYLIHKGVEAARQNYPTCDQAESDTDEESNF